MSSAMDDGLGTGTLRERLPHDPATPQHAQSSETAQATVKALNDEEDKAGKDEKEKKTYGRTPDGTGAFYNPLDKTIKCAYSGSVSYEWRASSMNKKQRQSPYTTDLLQHSLHRPANS